jgi:hypothetical protein
MEAQPTDAEIAELQQLFAMARQRRAAVLQAAEERRQKRLRMLEKRKARKARR